MGKQRIVLAGATGYLGRYIAQTLLDEGYPTRLIVRNRKKANFDNKDFDVVEAQVTDLASLHGVFSGIDVVISTVGITRQKDDLTYMDVDYQANANLLQMARVNGVKKFIYVGVLYGDKLRHLKVCEAKEKFVDELKQSGMDYCVIRPNGFFSDLREFLSMANSGRVYLFGDGEHKLNPIHGADLAKICVDAITSDEKEIEVGGPDILTQNHIGELAFEALNKKQRIIHFPDWIRKLLLWGLRTFTSQKIYGPLELFLTGFGMDMIAPAYGNHHLKAFYEHQTETL